MTDDLVTRIRTVFEDTPEVLSTLDDATTHMLGMWETLEEAADRIEELQTLVEVLLPPRRWDITDLVKKKSGAKWHGMIVGFYSTELTPIGYCVENAFEKNSVQMYPESALEDWDG